MKLKGGVLHWLNRLVGVALAVFAVWAAWRFPWGETRAALEQATYWPLAIAVITNLLGLVARSWAWHLLLKPAAPNRLKIALEASLIGNALASVSIAVAGEGSRAKFISRRDDVPMGLAVAAIVWSRVLEGVALVLLLLLAPPFLHLPPQLRWIHLAGVIVALVALIVLALRQRFSLSRYAPGFLRAPVETMKKIPFGGPRLVGPLVFSLMHWITQVATYQLTFLALGVRLPLAGAFVAVVVANLAWAFRFTPGNVGVMQGSIALALLPFGIATTSSVLAGILLQALQVIPVIALAAFFAGIRGLGRLKSEEEEESAGQAELET